MPGQPSEDQGEEDYSPSDAEMNLASEGGPRYSIQDPEQSRWELSTEDVIVWIEHDLRGERFDETKKVWEKIPDAIPMMNEKGIRDVVSILRNVNKITFLSDLEDEDILMEMRETHKDIAKLLYHNYELYDLRKSHLDIIVDKIIFIIYPALRRAWREGERKHRRSFEKRNYLIHEGPGGMHERKKILGLF